MSLEMIQNVNLKRDFQRNFKKTNKIFMKLITKKIKINQALKHIILY